MRAVPLLPRRLGRAAQRRFLETPDRPSPAERTLAELRLRFASPDAGVRLVCRSARGCGFGARCDCARCSGSARTLGTRSVRIPAGARPKRRGETRSSSARVRWLARSAASAAADWRSTGRASRGIAGTIRPGAARCASKALPLRTRLRATFVMRAWSSMTAFETLTLRRYRGLAGCRGT
jgi:hypothetical protein